MLLHLYNALWQLARPLLLRKLRRRGAVEPLYLHAVHQRFANYTPAERAQAQSHAGQWVWVHAVSLGETRAAAILLHALRARQPGLHVLLTHGTATGWQEGQKLLQPGDMQVWLPWDAHGAVQRFVQTFRPRVGLVMETEVWPQLLRACQQHGVPVALVNARLSAKTLRQSLRLKRLAAQSYGSLAVAYAQTAADADGLRQLGVQHTTVTGNLKFDATPDPALLQQGRTMRQRWQQHEAVPRPLAMLASSREGEEQLWLDALRQLPAAQQQAAHAIQWLIVPRHPQRFDEVAALLSRAGRQIKKRSNDAACGSISACDARLAGSKACASSSTSQALGPAPSVWLGDSIGEMPLYYAMADVVLMGGSFAPLGGQNLIEACACGCPVLLGRHTFNFAQASTQAIAAGAALRCADMADAVAHAAQLLLPSHPDGVRQRHGMQQAAVQFSQTHRGAAERVVADLQARGWLHGL